MKKNTKNIIMINVKSRFFVLFLCFFYAFFVLEHNYCLASTFSKTDTSVNSVEHIIDAFKYSNHKKEFNAIIINGLITAQNQGVVNNQEYLKLVFAHIENLYTALLFAEAGSLLNIIDVKELSKQKDIAKYYYLKGRYNLGIGNYKSALKYYDLALIFAHAKKDDGLYGRIIYSKAKTYLLKGDRQNALPLLLSAEKLLTDTILLIEAKRRISSSYCLLGNYKKALISINDALALICNDFDREINYFILKLNGFNSIDILPRVLQSRAYIYREMAHSSSDSIYYLNKSVIDSKASVKAFEQYKRSLIFETDLIDINESNKYFNYKTIEAILRLNNATQNSSLLYDALQYAEMDKSSALLRTVQKEIALEQSGISDSTVKYLKNLYKQLSKVEAKRFETNANIRIYDTALFELNLKLYDLILEIKQIEKKLEDDYPAYANLKYDVIPPNINFILKESYNKAIIEYVVSNEKLYAFLVVDGVIHINHFYFRDDFIESIEKLQQMISDINNIDFSLKELNEFETLSYSLYNVLLEPFGDKINGKPLLIVPDDELSLIPFEVLLTKPSKSKSLNYAALPYLVKSNNISYTYSLTLSHMQKKLVKFSKSNQILAMAPGYEKLDENKGNQYIALRSFCDLGELGMLEGAKEEAEQVSKQAKGMLLLDKGASELQFKINAPHYAILHLAMHTLINNENPLYSKLIFTPDVDKVEDGLLNTYELSNMQLNAELVVLSACNTGFGKLNKGEGIIGLTRGFLQAGCKSLLATLWSVADKASANLIKEFYDGLNRGQPKSFSISAAKRNYLIGAKGMDAHPFFWAGYISIGNDAPIKFDKKVGFVKTASIVLAVLVLSILIWFLYKRKFRFNR